MGEVEYAVSFKEQLTLRGMVIGAVGSVILTMSSLYVALKLGALPWPIIFVALASMFFLKFFKNSNINEINVTHTAMSAGAMTAGGLAFTIPGIYMLDKSARVNFLQLFFVVLGGVILGLIFTALIRKYFVVTKKLPYPMGQAAAETLMVGDEGGGKSKTLFSSLGIAGLFTFLRDGIPAVSGKTLIPATLMNQGMLGFGSLGGVWFSPMLISIGYIIGPVAIGVWFLGALFGDFGILIGAVAGGLLSPERAGGIKSSLGIGLMVGTGLGIILKGILPKAREIFGPLFSRQAISGGFIGLRWAPLVMALLAVLFTTICGMGVLPSVITILGVWLATAMSAQVVGQSGINPMEVFGIIILLAVKAISTIGQTEAFFVAAVVAIACGLVGDVMNDFKSGYILNSDPKAQWIAEGIGGLIGAVVSVGSFYLIIAAYGPSAFGPGGLFVAPQAGAVAAMVGGIPHVPSFIAGLAAGCILYVVNFPVMTLGLGVYLPFYLSLTAFIGGGLRFILGKAFPAADKTGKGLIISSGLLGGEAVMGVIIAICQAAAGLAGFGGLPQG
ncbi:MAG: OPT/YSL family transporter [Spirochaetaceae bacterium]|nr:OPT/YSL family transporter [Spirochaetaceae bacterium]